MIKMQLKAEGEALNQCIKYSEDKEVLKVLLKRIKVFLGEARYMPHFDDDKEKGIFRNVYTVTIKRGEKRLSFKYGDSINNTQKKEVPDLYSVLACLGSDYQCPDTFKDFCDDMKANKTFKKCLRMSQKLKAMFNEEEASSFPR